MVQTIWLAEIVRIPPLKGVRGMFGSFSLCFLCSLCFILHACRPVETGLRPVSTHGNDSLTESQKKVLAGAKKCLEAGFSYDNDMAYYVLKYRDNEYVGSAVYPNGDLEPSIGVCTDVTIRALRWGGVCDLQKEIHEDNLFPRERILFHYPTQVK